MTDTTITISLDEEESHKAFLLAALRAASLRCKVMEADVNTIGVALKGDLIGADTAVAWIRDSPTCSGWSARSPRRSAGSPARTRR